MGITELRHFAILRNYGTTDLRNFALRSLKVNVRASVQVPRDTYAGTTKVSDRDDDRRPQTSILRNPFLTEAGFKYDD